MVINPSVHCFNRRLIALAVAVVLPGAAMAAPTVTAVDAAGLPGANTTVSFDLGFGPSLPITGAALTLDWDPTVLTATGASATYNGVPVDVEAELSARGTYGPALMSPGNFAVFWSAIDAVGDALPALDLSGTGRLSFSFLLSPDVALGTGTPVSMSLGLIDAQGSPLEFLSGVATVSAVPEPAGYGLLLAGAAVMAVWARRRPATGT